MASPLISLRYKSKEMHTLPSKLLVEIILTVQLSMLRISMAIKQVTVYQFMSSFFRKNITNNPVCEYREIENTPHFCLHCNLNGQLRHALLDRVLTYCQPTVNVFLFGNTDLTDVENAELFLAVQDYILKKYISAKEQRYTFESSYNSCTHNSLIKTK